MPRLSPACINRALHEHRLLPRILRECGDLASARNELRWMQHHLADELKIDINRPYNSPKSDRFDKNLTNCANRRAKGEPLQYILGSQPFGDLDILCRKHVLIPRSDTELYTSVIAEILLQTQDGALHGAETPLRIADLCTGTGCISLLLHSILKPPTITKGHYAAGETELRKPLQIAGVDVSPYALRLSHDNLLHNIDAKTLNKTAVDEISFHQLDVLALGRDAARGRPQLERTSNEESEFLDYLWDVIISNPPYISPSDYAPGGSTTRSVRKYEPKLALVPPPLGLTNSASATDGALHSPADLNGSMSPQSQLEQADQFYQAILHIAQHANSKLIVMEIGDSNQARRVRAMIDATFADEPDIVLETWRDDGQQDRYKPAETLPSPPERKDEDGSIPAHERAIVVWRGEYAAWRRRTCLR